MKNNILEKVKLDIDINPMIESDLNDVLEIENSSFSSPWRREMFISEIKGLPFSHPFIVRDKVTKKILGYICFWIVFDELHLLNLAVDISSRENGIGKFLIMFSLSFSKEKGVKKGYLEVRESNNIAISLYNDLGFKIIGKRKNYYHSPNEDALFMEIILYT